MPIHFAAYLLDGKKGLSINVRVLDRKYDDLAGEESSKGNLPKNRNFVCYG